MLSRPMTPAGKRLLATASELFYSRGIHAVGVDLIAEQAGTTKKTLYDRFGSKDNLVALYLRTRFERWQAFVEERLAPVAPGRARLLAAFDVLDEWLTANTCGCAFVNANAEIGRSDHPGVAVIRAEKQWMRDRYEELATEAGLSAGRGGLREISGAGAGRCGRMRGMRTIGILLFDDVEELDAIGPWEVFSWWCARFPDDDWSVTTYSRDGGTVRCAKGLRVLPDHSFDDVPALDVLLYPGGRGARARVDDEAEVAWIRDQRPKVPLLASVCTGSLVFAKAGLLKGRPATSHWASLDRLASLDPTIDVRRDDRFVDDGNLVTSAGVSAGIDMALALAARLAGDVVAQGIQLGIEYDPAPEFHAGSPRSADAGLVTFVRDALLEREARYVG